MSATTAWCLHCGWEGAVDAPANRTLYAECPCCGGTLQPETSFSLVWMTRDADLDRPVEVLIRGAAAYDAAAANLIDGGYLDDYILVVENSTEKPIAVIHRDGTINTPVDAGVNY